MVEFSTKDSNGSNFECCSFLSIDGKSINGWLFHLFLDTSMFNNKMNIEVLKNIIEKLKSYTVLYEHGITSNVIEKCSFIVEMGALTIGTDDTGKVITQNTNTPSQFSQEAVDEIINMCFKNGNDE